jgi:NADPH:quinone reductase-like Zn-dependent oxidoreductase
VTCGSTSGMTAETNLAHLFQQQLRITASFGASFRNLREGLDKMAGGLRPVIDSEIGFADMAKGIERLKNRDVFGKIVMRVE